MLACIALTRQCRTNGRYIVARRHTEDLDLYSVNYLHYGAPKQWYVIPPAARQRFEGLIKGMIPDLFRACPEFFRHKVCCIM